VEYDLIPANPATGRRRRLKATKPARPWLEPEQLPALLDATTGTGRLLLELLAGAGLRIGEALALRFANVDTGVGSLYVVNSKTEKGVREVHLSPALREALVLARADRNAAPDDYVISTGTGRKHSPSNLRRDVLAPGVAAANETLEKAGIAPIGSITFHSLRRTYASLRCACGDPACRCVPPRSASCRREAGSQCDLGVARRQETASMRTANACRPLAGGSSWRLPTTQPFAGRPVRAPTS